LKAAHFTASNGSSGFGSGLTAQVWNESVLGSTLLASINLACASEKEIILLAHSWLLGNFIITKVLPSLIEEAEPKAIERRAKAHFTIGGQCCMFLCY